MKMGNLLILQSRISIHS